MSKIISIARQSNGGVIITVDNGVPRALDLPCNVIIKPVNNYTGCVAKADEENFRCAIDLADTITINGVAFAGTLSDLITILTQFVFGGEADYATPAKISQTITFAAFGAHVHTDAAFYAGATASSGLGVTYVSSDPTKATVDATSGLITPIAAGSTDITASQAGNTFYSAASPVARTLTLS